MAVACDRIRRETGLPIGVNVLANAALHALAVACASGARFVRVNQWVNAYVANEGLIEGAAATGDALSARTRRQGVRILADAHVKHGAHAIVQDRPIAELVRDVEFFNADASSRPANAPATPPISTTSGASGPRLRFRRWSAAVSRPTMSRDILAIVDGVIVASALKVDGRWWNPVDPARAEDLRRARRARAVSGERMPSQVSNASFCETLRARARSTWDAAADHRFFHEVASDALAEDVFARYLCIEYGFIDTAAVALGYAVAKAPSFQERRHLALNLHGLVTIRSVSLWEAFEQINAPHDQRSGLPPQGRVGRAPRAVPERGDDGRIRGDFGLFLGAEWLYLTWCSRANRTPSAHPAIRDWVALHAGGAFAEGVAWLRSKLDKRGPRLTAARQARLGISLSERSLRRLPSIPPPMAKCVTCVQRGSKRPARVKYGGGRRCTLILRSPQPTPQSNLHANHPPMRSKS